LSRRARGACDRAPRSSAPLRFAAGRAESRDHSARENFRLVLGVSPEQVVTHLVIYHRDPQALAEVHAPALPVFRMHEMNATVFVGAAGSLAPIDILEPFDSRAAHVEVAAHRGYRAVEIRGAMSAKKFSQVSINFAPSSDGRNNHSHVGGDLR
jgi:hypothetical protein